MSINFIIFGVSPMDLLEKSREITSVRDYKNTYWVRKIFCEKLLDPSSAPLILY